MRAVIPASGFVVLASAATLFETATTHNARQRRAPDSRFLFESVPRLRRSVIAKSADFRPNSAKAAVRKTAAFVEEEVGSCKC